MDETRQSEQLELHIVPGQDEEANRRKAEEAARLQEFIGQWTMDNVPACDQGMLLLMRFAKAHPNAYELARQRGFVDLTHPMFTKIRAWIAFTDHVNRCPKCNEV